MHALPATVKPKQHACTICYRETQTITCMYYLLPWNPNHNMHVLSATVKPKPQHACTICYRETQATTCMYYLLPWNPNHNMHVLSAKCTCTDCILYVTNDRQ